MTNTQMAIFAFFTLFITQIVSCNVQEDRIKAVEKGVRDIREGQQILRYIVEKSHD